MWMLWASFLVRWALLAAAVALTAWVLPDVALEGGVWASLWVALLIAFANVVVQLLLGIIPKPNAFLVLAVLTLAVNGLLVWAVSAVSGHFTVDGFLAAVGAAILISVFSVALEAVVGRLLPDDRARGDAVPG
jgi:putative membrane protein